MPKSLAVDMMLVSDEQNNQLLNSSHVIKMRPRGLKRILIIDDDDDIVLPLEKILTQFGCHVVRAADGANAVTFLSHQKFDLVFLDWKLPDIEGGETLRVADWTITQENVNSEEDQSDLVPVVTYSSQALRDMKIPRVEHFSIVDHWHKPMDYGELGAQVREILRYLFGLPH